MLLFERIVGEPGFEVIKAGWEGRIGLGGEVELGDIRVAVEMKVVL